MYWRIIWFLITKVLWRKDLKVTDKDRLYFGNKLYHWFSSYEEIDKNYKKE